MKPNLTTPMTLAPDQRAVIISENDYNYLVEIKRMYEELISRPMTIAAPKPAEVPKSEELDLEKLYYKSCSYPVKCINPACRQGVYYKNKTGYCTQCSQDGYKPPSRIDSTRYKHLVWHPQGYRNRVDGPMEETKEAGWHWYNESGLYGNGPFMFQEQVLADLDKYTREVLEHQPEG